MPDFNQSPLNQTNVALALASLAFDNSNLAVLPSYSKLPPFTFRNGLTNFSEHLLLVAPTTMRTRPLSGRRLPLRAPDPVFPPPNRLWPRDLALVAPLLGRGTIAGTASSAPLVFTDNFPSNVSLLLSMDGSNGSTTFTDSGAFDFTVTANGNAQISTAQSKWGGASGLFDGSGDWLVTQTSSQFAITDDFTVEFWIRAVSTAGAWAIAHINAGGANGLHFYNNGSAFLVDNGLAADYSSSAGVIKTTDWTFIAVTKSGTTLRIYADGVLLNSRTAQSYGTPDRCQIGRYSTGGIIPDMNAYIDDFRLTRGVARYTGATHQVPPSAFPPVDPNFSSVSVLLPFDGANNSTTFTDRSNNNLTITRSGSAVISTAQSRFGGASLRLNPGSDCLDIPGSALLSFPGNFTIEAWVRLDVAQSSFQTVIELGDYTNGILIRASGNTGDVWINGNNLGNIASFFTANTWHFIHASRSGTSVTVAVDGTTRLTSSISGTLNSTNAAARIGIARHTSGQQLVGYIDDLRITKGVARSSSVVPTRAFPTGGP